MNERNSQTGPKEQVEILLSFYRTLMRESHILTKHPELLWQQLFNRLQWDEVELNHLLLPELHNRKIQTKKPWLQQITRIRESESLTRILTGHKDIVTSCSFSPSGYLLASTSTDNSIKLWDPTSGFEKITLEGHKGPVLACAFSPDGQTLASTSQDKSVRLWDINSGKEIAILNGHSGYVTACAFSPNGEWIISTGMDKKIIKWNVANKSMIDTFRGHTGPVYCCAFYPDGSRIISASKDKKLIIWDFLSGEKLHVLEGHRDSIFDCAISPDSKIIVSASIDKTLKVWYINRDLTCVTLDDHKAFVQACKFSTDGSMVISGSGDKTLKIWNVKTCEVLANLIGHSGAVYDCCFSPDGQNIASAGADNSLRLWNFSKSIAQIDDENATSQEKVCDFSSDGQNVYTVGASKVIKLWDTETGIGSVIHPGDKKFEDGFMKVTAGFSPDGKKIVSTIPPKLWAAAKRQFDISSIMKGANSFSVSQDESTIVSACDDKTLKLWDSSTLSDYFGNEQATLVGHKGAVLKCSFSPDGFTIVSASCDRTLKLWDVKSQKELVTFVGHKDWVNDCSFSPDGQRIVSASSDTTLKIWDVGSGSEILTLIGHTRRVTDCAYSPNGSIIVSVSWDHTIKFWNALNGIEICSYPTFGKVDSCAFNPIGDKVSFCESNNLHILNLIGNWSGEALTVVEPSNSKIYFDQEQMRINTRLKRHGFFNKKPMQVREEAKAKRYWLYNLLIYALALLLSLGGYALTRISPWFWILAGMIFIISIFISGVSYFLVIYVCPYCGWKWDTKFYTGDKGDFLCPQCRGTFKSLI